MSLSDIAIQKSLVHRELSSAPVNYRSKSNNLAGAPDSSFSVNDRLPAKGKWILPAILCLLFLGLSLVAIATGDWLGPVPDHTRNFWGNQVWVDLLLAVGIGWFLVVPQAKKAGMSVLPWFILIVLTGCVGFTAMLARLLYLQEKDELASG